MKALILWAKTHKVITGVILIALFFAGYRLYPRTPVSPYETVSAEKGSLVQEVTVTGKVEAESAIDLAFEGAGRIVSVGALVGEHVVKGQPLLRLDASSVSASLSQAQANLQFEEAQLEKLLRGARPEEIQVSQVTLDNAESSLLDAENSLDESITDAYTKSDDAIRNKTDILFLNPRVDPQFVFSVTDYKESLNAMTSRKSLESRLVTWSQNLQLEGDLPGNIASAKQNLSEIKKYLETLALLVNVLTPSSALAQTTIDGYKTNVSTARTNISTAITTLVTAEEKWRAAKSAVALAAEKLALTKAGATSEDLAAQRAKISSARASVATYQSQMNKLSLVAPFEGVVTKQDGKQGAIALAGTPLVSVQSKGAYKIEANVPEVDIAKLSEGDEARITLDAYGDGEVFLGTIARIDPAGRIIDGVPTYRITLRFEDTGDKVRSGMTANIVIATDKRDDVVIIPARALSEKDGKRVVRVLLSGVPVEREVSLGLRGSDGKVEILSGVAEGEPVIVFEKKS